MSLQSEISRGADATGTSGRPAGQLTDKVRSLRISSPPAPQGGGSSKLAWFLCLLLGGGAGYLGWEVYQLRDSAARLAEGDGAVGGAVTPGATAAPNTAEIAAAASAAGMANSGGVVHESKGYLLPRHQILISPKVSGMVKSLRVHKPGAGPEEGEPLIEGMRVDKGDILAQLETTDYDADVLHAEANLARAELRLAMERTNIPREIERAQAELSEAITQQEFYKSQLDRWLRLSKSSTVSPSDIEKAQSDFESAGYRVERLRRALDLITEPKDQRIKVAESDVEVTRAELTKAVWKQGNTTIVSPVTATVLKKNVEEGNIVNPVAFNGSFSICDLADLADLEVELDIQERDISRIFVGQKCVVRAEAFQDHPYDGYVSRLMPIANRSKGSIPVRVKVKIPPGMEGVHLKPEMGAIVAFYKTSESDVAAKPAAPEADEVAGADSAGAAAP